MKSTLFVGGIADGEWLFVPEGMSRWLVEIPEPPRSDPFPMRPPFEAYKVIADRMAYQKECLRNTDGTNYFVFVPAGSQVNLIEQLIENYKPQGH